MLLRRPSPDAAGTMVDAGLDAMGHRSIPKASVKFRQSTPNASIPLLYFLYCI